ncbi:siderophore-interacting protein [Erwinia sp. SLM-02]|uniref:siderophore-interacting protein n=1 Tax=Erwinia sp. SLM-02 TaxID=3020057 RepID=UPI003FCE748C
MLSENKSRAPKRVRNELRFRQITVAAKTLVAENFWRIDFIGDDLAGFVSPGFDDHIKVFFPDAATGELHLPEVTSDGVVWKEGARPASRDYTPLWFDGVKNTLTLDFYIHDGGVASNWAAQAKVGDPLAIGGPRGSMIVPEDYAFQLYVCDESGLPAFKRRKETVQGGVRKLFAFADEASGSLYLDGLNGIDASWIGSGKMHGEPLRALISELDSIQLPLDDYFIWLTGEGDAVKQLNDYFVIQRGCDENFVRAVAYWHQK